MALLQISEPSASPPVDWRRAAGIDLGTTHSLIATVSPQGSVKILLDSAGQSLLPSIVHYQADSTTVGWAAQRLAVLEPQNTLISTKRLLGRSLAELVQPTCYPYLFQESDQGELAIVTPQGAVTPVQISAEILMVLAQRAQSALDGALEGVVITVPAYFDERQRQATQAAAKEAGLLVLRLLNEPTAAAVAYGLQHEGSGMIAVYDLGGGTFDISLLRLADGVFEVLATGGDTLLGGDDFDQRLVSWLAKRAGYAQPLSLGAQQALLESAINLKKALSEQEEVAVQLAEWQGIVTRSQFNALIEPFIQKTLMISKRALQDAAVTRQQIEQVVLVGGSTRIPRIREAVAHFFNRQPLVTLDPDQVVAMGAALYANQLIGNSAQKPCLLLDVTPLTLGIETLGGLVQPIMARNTTIPAVVTQQFTMGKTGQRSLLLHVVQGESEQVSACRSLACFVLRGLPSLEAGQARIQVTFQIDENGLLEVTAVERSSGIHASIQVQPSNGLTEALMQQMLQSVDHEPI